jgi:hypothetical protein
MLAPDKCTAWVCGSMPSYFCIGAFDVFWDEESIAGGRWQCGDVCSKAIMRVEVFIMRTVVF